MCALPFPFCYAGGGREKEYKGCFITTLWKEDIMGGSFYAAASIDASMQNSSQSGPKDFNGNHQVITMWA